MVSNAQYYALDPFYSAGDTFCEKFRRLLFGDALDLLEKPSRPVELSIYTQALSITPF